jgi:predicted nucleotidyltransferase
MSRMIDLVSSNLPRIKELCRQNRVRQLFLVGSATSEGGFDPARSDIDFLVEFEPHERKGFDDVYFVLREELETLLGRKVDLIERGCVRNPYVLASLENTKVPLYAAA